MKSRLSALLFLAFGLISCDKLVGTNNFISPGKIFDKKASDATPHSLQGYWEGGKLDRSSTEFQEQWRLMIDEDHVYFAVRCQEGTTRSQTGARVRYRIEDEGSRLRLTFSEDFDFRVGDSRFVCGDSVKRDNSVYLYFINGYQLEVVPMFQGLRFEKISDL